MTIFRRFSITLVALALGAYLGGMAGLYFLQRNFQYDPSGRIWQLEETRLGAVAEAVSIPVAGGAVAGWYAPPRDAGKPVILFYRGNAGSFTHEYARFERFTDAGYGFLSFDYRGFPGSPGAISQTDILADSLAAFDWLVTQGFPIVLWGRSLGSGPATYVASEREATALMLETPFVSAVSVAYERYWFFPVGWLMQDQFPVDRWLQTVDEPVYVAHGTADQTIGVSHGQRVYALAGNPRGLWIEPGAGHSDLWARGIWERAEPFIAAAMAQ